MKEYHKLEDDLFARWRAKWDTEDPKIQKLHRLVGGEFCKSPDVIPDGMMYRGEITFDKGDWDRKQGDEYERWENAPLRLIMLTKDNIADCEDGNGNRNTSWDKRYEIACNTMEGYQQCQIYGGQTKFYPNYIRWIYCMLKPKKVNGRWQAPSFEEASNWKKSMRYMIKEAPLVRVNVKKQTGSSTKGIPNYILKWFIDAYADEIIEQINIYGANIIFCCGHDNLDTYIPNLLKESIFPDLKHVAEDNNTMLYSPSHKVLVVKGYHPSCRNNINPHEDIYNNLKEAYEDFLQQYPGFPMGI